MHRERFYTLSASCPDRTGIVAKVSGFIAEHKGVDLAEMCVRLARNAEDAFGGPWGVRHG